MQLLIDATRNYRADQIARTIEDGKKALSENNISVLYVDHDFGDAQTGSDILQWANQEKLLPPQVVLVTANPFGRNKMSRFLSDKGYSSADGIRFIQRPVA